MGNEFQEHIDYATRLAQEEKSPAYVYRWRKTGFIFVTANKAELKLPEVEFLFAVVYLPPLVTSRMPADDETRCPHCLREYE